MRRWVAVLWHASFSCIAAALYFLFVLPRWWELTGVTTPTLGTVMRIVTGALIGLAALPVVFTLLRTRRPEFRTPLLALRLRTASIALHIVAGVLIIGAAISEIWLSLDEAGQWLFGLYGAAAAIALLGIFAFYLADIAELPPPPPKPLKPKTEKQRRGRGAKAEDDNDGDEAAEDEASSETTADDEATATRAPHPTPMTRLRTNRPRSRPNPRSPTPSLGPIRQCWKSPPTTRPTPSRPTANCPMANPPTRPYRPVVAAGDCAAASQ